MKRIILMLGMLVCILAAKTVFAQQQGVITYENRINLHRTVPENMKAMVPEFRVSKLELIFNAEESLYKPIIEDEEEQSFSSGQGVRMTMKTPKSETYVNTAQAQVLKIQELMGKKYLVEDSIKVSPWKFGTETKDIMGYTCHMAYYTHTQEIKTMSVLNGVPTPQNKTVTQDITAWYTDQIRPNLGPDEYNTLPGTVLAVDVNNGERVLVARNIELRELKKKELQKPESGTKVTVAEFRKIQEEQIEKMHSTNRTFRMGQ